MSFDFFVGHDDEMLHGFRCSQLDGAVWYGSDEIQYATLSMVGMGILAQ